MSDHSAGGVAVAPNRAEPIALTVAVTISAVHLLGHALTVGGARELGGQLTGPTQILLMLGLAAWLWWSTRSAAPTAAVTRLLRWTLIALMFSWAGDSLPGLLTGDAAFIAMVGGFLLAQIAYIIAFGPLLMRALRGTSPIPSVKSPQVIFGIAIVYALVVAFLAMLLLPHTGVLSVPVVAYGICLGAMGVAAWSLGPAAGIGGAIFFFSDALIAVGKFLPALFDAWPYGLRSLIVMATYLTGQWLLITVVRRTLRIPALVVDVVSPATTS